MHAKLATCAAALAVLAVVAGCGPASRAVTTDRLLAMVRDAPVAAGHTRCAVFDADGTLWDFDLSSTLVRQTLRDRTAGEGGLAAMNALLAAFGLPPGADVYAATRAVDEALDSGALHAAGRSRGWDEDEVNARVWPHYNWLYLGMPAEAVVDRARRLLSDPSFRARVFPGMRAVVAALRSRGYRVRVISGGVHEFVAAGAAEAGFLSDEVRGLKVAYRDGRLTGEVVAPVPYQQGKATIARELCGGRPMFAFGDSVASGDAAMLDLAALPVAVRPAGRHREAARRRGMLVYERPEAPGAR